MLTTYVVELLIIPNIRYPKTPRPGKVRVLSYATKIHTPPPINVYSV